MTEVVEITEDELTQKDLSSPVSSFVRPRPVRNSSSHHSRSSAGQSLLKPVTEKDETSEELSASIRSFDGIDIEALQRLSAVEDSQRSNRSALSTLSEGDKSQSSSSSSGKRSVRPSRVKKMTDQTRKFGGGSLEGSERTSISSYDQLGSSMSLSSHAFSKSSISTIGLSFELGEGEDPLITPPPGPKKGVPKMSPANASICSMPSLSEFSTAPSTSSLSGLSLHDRSAHSSIMPSLGNILEEDVSFSSASFASFNTGTSFSTGTNSDNMGIIIGGRPMAEILKDQDKIAGKTLDVLAPSIPVKKPTTKRWTSEETAIMSNESPSHDDAPMVARRRISDNSYSEFGALVESSPGPDIAPQMIRRQDTASSLSMRISDVSAAGELREELRELGDRSFPSDLPPTMAQRQDTFSSMSIRISDTSAITPNYGQLAEHSPRSNKPPTLPGRPKESSTSSSQIRISDASACHFGELAEYSPGPDLAPRVVHRQDTDSSTPMPDLSPLHSSGTRGRVKNVSASGGRKGMPELSPPRGDGAHRFSRRTVKKPNRVESSDDEEVELIVSQPKRVASDDEDIKAPTKKAPSPKIWSRSGSKSFGKSVDRPPTMTRRKVSG